MSGRRVAFVEFTPSGGLYQFTAQLAGAMADRGHEVHLYTGPRPEFSPAHPNLRIHPVLPTWHPADAEAINPVLRKLRRVVRAGQLALAWFVLFAHLARRRPDVVVWSNWRYTIDAAGVLAVDRLLPKARLAVIAHEPIPRRPGDTTTNRHGLLLDPALDRSWRAMDAVFVLGEEARTRVHSRWRPAGPVVVIPHGDEGVLRGDDPIPDADTTDPVVLFFGTWSAYKGIDVLFDAVPEVRRRVPDARVIVAGAVAGVDQAALEARARELGVETRPGYVASADVPALFGAARVVVTPYRRATQSGVIHLAYTFERPVVATSVGDLPAVVQHERTGLLVPPDDPAALADALVTLLSDADLARRMGAEGAKWLADEASWAAVAARVDEGLGLTAPNGMP